MVVDHGVIRWMADVPPDILGYPYSSSDPLSLLNFLTIARRPIPNLLPSNIEKSLEIASIPLQHAGAGFLIRSAELRDRIETFVDHVENLMELLGKYQDRYTIGMQVLSRCKNAKYSRSCLLEVDAFHKIKLSEDDFAPRPIYNLSNGKTGRMTITAGSQILTSPHEVKKCIRSRFDGGKIIEIDFSALEPRTALAIMGSELAQIPDIYTHIGSLFSPPLDREKAKQVTISFLYGATKGTIRHLVDGGPEIDGELDKLKVMFGFDEIVDNAIAEVKRQGFFRNHAGRPIFPQSSKRGLLFNNFCQSSAVDVALSGFSALLDEMSVSCLAEPLYFIHDALILDVPATELDLVKEKCAYLPTYLGINFPTKVKILHN